MKYIICSMSSDSEGVRRKPSRKRFTKQEKQEIFQKGPFSTISSFETLLKFFQENPNVYHAKVITLLENKKFFEDSSPETKAKYDEVHHIIPQSSGGPDEPWNLLPVTYEEHKELHRLRYEVYGQEGDRMASMSRDEIVGYTKKQKTEASKRGHKTMRELGIGFNNPEQQAEFGRRSAAVGKTPNRVQGYVSQSRTRNSVYPSLFEKPIIFSFTDAENQLEILVAASTFQRTGEIRDFLLKNTPETSRFFEKIQNDKSFPSNFNKVLRNLLPVEQQFETRPQYQGWKVKFGNDQTN